MNHEAPGDSNNYNDLITLGHETTHGINNYIRNQNRVPGKTINAFYVLNNQAVIVEEPNMRKSKVAAFVPSSLQGSRYSLYVVGSTGWDDRPLYIYDEWVAYVNGSAAGIDLVKRGKWTYGWRDGVAGTMEFVVYGLAVAMAAEKHDPSYLQNKQFLEFTAWLIQRSMELFREGAQMKDFKWNKQDQYYQSLKTSPDAQGMRDFCKRIFGANWTQSILLK